MKVLIISPRGLPVPAVKGGAVQSLIEILLSENQIENKVEISVICPYNKKAKEKAKIYSKINFIFNKEYSIIKKVDSIINKLLIIIKKSKKEEKKDFISKLLYIKKIRKEMSINDYDKVVFENSGFLLRTLKSKKISNKYENKLYYHLHNDIPDNIYIKGIKKCKILLISNYLGIKIKRICGNDIEKNFIILKNGFDCKRFNQKISTDEKEMILKKLNINQRDNIILFVGRINPSKGVKELLSAFKKIPNRYNAKLIIIGSHNFGDNNTSNYEKEVKTIVNNLKDKVRFTGFVSYEDVWKYYNISTIAVLPSMWEEPAGLTMLEACASAIPLITTISGGIPEYLNNKYANFVCRDEKIINNIYLSIIDILKNKDKYLKKAKMAQKYVIENYDKKVYYNNFIKIIKK